MPKMTNNAYRNKMIIQEKIGSQTIRSNGDWIDCGYLFAQLIPMRGSEIKEGKQRGQTDFLIKTPYQSGIDHTKRLLMGSRVFNITAVINVGEDNRELEISAYEIFKETGHSHVVGMGAIKISNG